MSKPLSITIAQGAFLPVPPLLGGAVEKAWHALGQEFARQGHRVVHLSRTHSDLPVQNQENGVLHQRVPGYPAPRALWQLKARDLAYSRRVARILPPADILVTNTFWLPLLARRPSRGRTYVHVARYPKGQLRFYPRRAILQTVSQPIRDAILRELPRAGSRVRVIPYPLAPAYLAPFAAARPVVLYTGRLHPEKGVHLLIDAFVRSAARWPGWTLRIVGPWKTEQGGGGPAYRAQLAAAAQPAGARVQILDPVFNEHELVQHYREAAVFAYPSLAEFGETFGLAVLEAMAAGCAPVVSSLSCFGDFVRDGENGLIFDHRAAAPAPELAGALDRLISRPDECDRLRLAAWNTARAYALPVIARQFLNDFAALAEPRSSPLSSCLPNPI